MDPKPLTPAQRRTMIEYNRVARQALDRLDQFIAYLRDEHDAPAPAWVLTNVDQGFVPNPAPPTPNDDEETP